MAGQPLKSRPHPRPVPRCPTTRPVGHRKWPCPRPPSSFPGRLESTRFPRKLLHPDQGQAVAAVGSAERHCRAGAGLPPLVSRVDHELLARRGCVTAGVFQRNHDIAGARQRTAPTASPRPTRTVRADHVHQRAGRPNRWSPARRIRELARLIGGEAPHGDFGHALPAGWSNFYNPQPE